jgi:hypothetical protein
MTMKDQDIAALAKRLNRPPDSGIPGSDECKNRFAVALRVSNGKEVRERTFECVYVGERGVMIVWKWKKIPGIEEEVPDIFTRLPEGRQSLVQVGAGSFSLDVIVTLPRGQSLDE